MEAANGVDGAGLELAVRQELFDLYSQMRGCDDDYQPELLSAFGRITAGLPRETGLMRHEQAVPLGPRSMPGDDDICTRSPASFDIVYLTSAGYIAATIVSLSTLLRCAPQVRPAITVYCTDGVAAACMQARFEVATRVWPCGALSASMSTYRHQTFNQIASLKTRILYGHLARGRPVLYSDGDVVWHADPSARMAELMDGDDSVAMCPDKGVGESVDEKAGGHIACTGVIMARPSPESLALFAPERHPPWCGDQASVNHVLQEGKSRWRKLDGDGLVHHWNGMNGNRKLVQMAAAAANIQDGLHALTAGCRVPPHTNTGYSGPWIEQSYYLHWLTQGAVQGSRVYLPVFWTDVQVTAWQMVQGLQHSIRRLPDTVRYYTVVQHAKGPAVTFPESLDVRTFCAGRRCGDACRVVPLLKRELACASPDTRRDIAISFTGTVNPDNDLDGVRSRALAACTPHGLVWHHGRGWEDVLRRSRYALCVRGWGPTSFRLYEAVQAGAIPIVVWEHQLVMPDNCGEDWAVVMHIDELDSDAGRARLAELVADEEGTAVRAAAVVGVREHCTYAGVNAYISEESEAP